MLGFVFRWMGIGAAAGALAVLTFTSVGSGQALEIQAGDVETTADRGSVARVTWSEAGDVWLGDMATGDRRPLTHDGEAGVDYLPRFHGSDRVTYVVREGEDANLYRPGPGSRASVIRELNLVTGGSTDLARFPGGVGAQAWSPDGTTLAVLNANGDGTPYELRFVTRDGAVVVRRLAEVRGRGGFDNYDETRVEWAPDGRHLLVLETGFDTSQDETLYLLRADGTDALPPRPGAWARWGADSKTVYCVCAGPVGEDWFWQALDIDTRVGTPVLLDRAMRPALSPDGRFLAFDDGEDTPAVHVLELVPGARSRLVTRGAVAPRWIDAAHVAVTDTRPCPGLPDDCMAGGHGSLFHPAGTTSVVDVITGERRSVPPFPTEDADVTVVKP